MADRIRLLPEIVANQIAAGQVVDNPASVVKEMMENAVDAGARTVKVNYRDYGKELIHVADDGCGMSPVDAQLAFDRHATSKIRTVEDIYALHTFGFRGEALASIAAVAQVELRTRQEGDEMGSCTEIHGGRFVSQEPVMCPVGSQFFVRNLFYNVPAKRKFTDNKTALARQIRTEFQRVAFCYPDIGFELYANDAPISMLRPASLAGRIVDIVGKFIKQNLLEVEAQTSIASVRGYIGRPEAAKNRNPEQFLFINGRYFESAYLTSAVLKAYEKLIPANCRPSYFLYFDIDPSRIDVNIGAKKTQVKFADEAAVWQIVHAAVRETLAKTGAVSMMDFDRESDVEIPVFDRRAVYREPQVTSNREYNPFQAEYIDPSAPDPNVDFAGYDVPYAGGGPEANRADDDRRNRLSDHQTAYGRSKPKGGYSSPGGTIGVGADEFDDFVSAGAGRPASAAPADSDGWFGEVRAATSFGAPDAEEASGLDFIPSEAGAQQQRLNMASPVVQFTDPLPAGAYIVAFMEGELTVVDVRRARERILYEHYMQTLGRATVPSQQLLFPERLEVSAAEYALLEEHAVEFAALGFDLDLCGDGVIEAKGTPADQPADAVDRLLYELLQAFAMPVPADEVRRERIAAVMARGGAQQPVRTLSRDEAQALLDRLAATGKAALTPSGKRIAAVWTPEELRAKLG